MKQNKTFKIILTLTCFLAFNVSALANTTPIPGVGVVSKKNNCKPKACTSSCNHGGASKVGVTNEKGQVQINISEAGDYTLLFGMPITRTSQAMVAGGPIGGLIVKTGGNPNGSLIVIGTTNDKGEVEWKGVVPGSYIIMVESNGENCPTGFEFKGGVCVPKGDRTVNQEQSLVNISKSNIKDRIVRESIKKVKLEPVITQAKTETAGGPISGTVVKGGCNGPCDHKFSIITKDDGSFSTKLEEGNYTISVNADELKKTIAELKSKDEKINGATFVFDLPANFEFSGTEKPNEKGAYVAPKFEFTINVPKEGTTFSGKLLTTTTAGLSIKPTVNEKGTGQPKGAGF